MQSLHLYEITLEFGSKRSALWPSQGLTVEEVSEASAPQLAVLGAVQAVLYLGETSPDSIDDRSLATCSYCKCPSIFGRTQ